MSEEQRQLIADIEARESLLTNWERRFIDDISRKDSLTHKQNLKLEEIWERVTDNG